MRRLLFTVILSAALAPAAAQNKVGTTAAAFLGIGTDARAMAMGGAQTAIAAGSNAIYWNPAGLASLESYGVSVGVADWILDTQLQHFTLGLATDLGRFGLHIVRLDYGELEVTTIESPEGTGEIFTPSDFSVGVAYARALTDRFSAGGTFKFVRQKVWNETANGVAVDLGVQYRTDFQNLRIGMSMSNFGSDMRLAGKDLREAIDIEPDLAGNNPNLAANLEVDSWPMPLVFRVGIAADVFQSSRQRLTFGADAIHPSDNSESANFGLEYTFREILFIRGGYRQAFAELNEDGGWTVGFGLQYRMSRGLGASLDYVFMDYGDLGTPQMWTLQITF